MLLIRPRGLIVLSPALSPLNQIIYCLTAQHDPRLVLIAGLVSFLSAAVGYDLLARATAERGIFWLSAAAVVTGSGIWATHFIAMLAYDPGFSLGYGVLTTALSGVAGTVISGLAFAILVYGRGDRTLAPLAGVILGGGVAVLHYVGVAAVVTPGAIRWDWILVLWSIGLGCALGAVSAWLFSRATTARQRLLAAVVLTLAVCAHHFTAMGAIAIQQNGSIADVVGDLPKGWLVIAIVAAMVGVLLLGLIGGTFDRMLASRELREARRLSALANAAFEGIVICRNGVIADANESFCRLVGVRLDALRGKALADQISEGSRAAFTGALSRNVSKTFPVELFNSERRTIAAEMLRRASDNDDSDEVIFAVRDLREREAAERRIRFLAHHDSLTGLANRTFFGLRFDDAIAKARRSGGMLAFHYVDVDRFKEINDTFGHSAGDALLKETARQLEAIAGPADIVARLGGDEFAIVQVDVRTNDEAVVFAERVCEALAKPVSTASGIAFTATASVGVAVFPADGADSEGLTHSADVALYRAKAAGRATFRAFEPGMGEELRNRRALQQELTQAIADGHFRVEYQPQLRIAGGEVIGFEALVRWLHPQRGVIPPAVFIPLSEENGTILQLGEWVLRTACRDAMLWQRPLRVAVNLSPVQIARGDLPSTVQAILFETGLPASRLELEVTEGILIDDIDRTLRVLRRLKALGVSIAMDDFGTGYSSLSYLQSFPFDKLKIDRSFVCSVDDNAHSRAIVRAVVGLGHALGLPVVAEGVETRAQLEVLRYEACEQVQGFLTGRPAPIESFSALVNNEEATGDLTPEAMQALAATG